MAAVKAPMHRNLKMGKDRRDHVIVSYVDQTDNHITTKYGYVEDILEIYGV